jgi:ketosteroid isomerase-like protein
MSDLKQKEAAKALINEFAVALSTPDSKSISNFYSDNGLFFPNSYPTQGKDQLENAKGKFLKNRKFTIEFEIDEIVIQNGFAFVNAVATTTELTNGLLLTKLSRDFLVLREDSLSWKIYRYMFNDLRAPSPVQ